MHGHESYMMNNINHHIKLINCFGTCRVIGAVLIVIGLYAVLWGKQKENQVTICELAKIDSNSKVTEDVEANGSKMKISEGDNSMLSTIVISVPLSETHLKKTIQEP